MATYQDRFEDNARGSYFVDDTCIDCDLCRERAPEIFRRNDEDAHSFVAIQPGTPDEIALCEEALEDCPMEAIGNDGALAESHEDMTRKNRCQLPGIVQQ